MGFKGVLLYKDIPSKDWPEKSSGNYIYKIVDLGPSKQFPDKRPWRLMTDVEIRQYARALEDDLDNARIDRDELTADERIDLALDRAEQFGKKMFKEFKRENVKSGITKGEVRQMARDLAETERLMVGGSLKGLLEELANLDLLVLTYLTEERVLRYGNEVRAYLGLEEVETQAELDDGVS